jgi:hypothetical protein
LVCFIFCFRQPDRWVLAHRLLTRWEAARCIPGELLRNKFDKSVRAREKAADFSAALVRFSELTSGDPRQSQHPRRPDQPRCRRSGRCHSNRHRNIPGARCIARAGHNCSCRRTPAE